MSHVFSSALALLVVASMVCVDGRSDPEKAREAEKRLAKLKEYCAERRTTHVVELLAEWGEFAGQDQHDVVMEMAAKMVKDACAECEALGESRGIPTMPIVKFRNVSNTSAVKNLYKAGSTFFVEEFCAVQMLGTFRTPEKNLEKQLIIASTRHLSRPNSALYNCIILTNDACAEVEDGSNCLIVSSGSIASYGRFKSCTVIARGDVEYRVVDKESSLIRAGGKFVDPISKETKGEIGQFPPDPRRAFPYDKQLLGVKFYSVNEDGLEATADAERKTVTVTNVEAKKPFAKVGVLKGDEILSVNGDHVSTLHELDRLICRGTVASGVAKLKLKRDGKEDTVEVKLFDWDAYKPPEKKDEPKTKPPEKK